MRVYYKTYFKCGTQSDSIVGLFGAEVDILTQDYTFNGVLEDDGTYSSAPAWFNEYDFYPIGSCGWVLSPPNESGTSYKFSWDAEYHTGEVVEYIVELVMLSYCSVDIDGQGCKADGQRVLAWLNREGGWSYFTFAGKTTFEVTIPEASRYQNSDYILRNNSRDGVYDGELVTTGDIPVEALDLLASLKTSVQAYFIDGWETSYPVYKPIVIQDGDFIKRKTGDKRFDVSVKFIYAEKVQIQTQ